MSQNDALKQARAALFKIPAHEYFEVPGKADVLYELRDYSLDPERGAEKARLDIPFLFKPFEVGQKPPSSKGRELHFGREPTIHEYLDWTVTAATLDTLDFSGFRVLTLLPRYRPFWPPPLCEHTPEDEKRHLEALGAPKEPIPFLMPCSRPISATTIRSGATYIEVPFFATKQSARGKGYGKALLYAIEDLCRFLDRPKILLCSTDDSGTISTWQHLGFHQAQPHELTEWGIAPTELVHMTNTVQMVKHVRERPDWKSIQIRHEGFIQRLYYLRSDHVTSPSKKRKELPSHESTQRKATRLDASYTQKPNVPSVIGTKNNEASQNGIDKEKEQSSRETGSPPEKDQNNIIEPILQASQPSSQNGVEVG